MFDLKRIRPLDAVITAVLVIVVALGGYLGFSVWNTQRSVKQATPASRTLESLMAAVRKDPDNLALRVALAESLAAVGKRSDAIRQYEQILEKDKEHVPAIAGLGVVALGDGEFKMAEAYFKKVLDLTEGDSTAAGSSNIEKAYFYLGTAVMEQKRYEEAAGYFKEALRYRRDNSSTHYLLAVCLREMGLDAAYSEALGNTLLFDPKHPEANYDMGMVLLKEGDRAAAAEHFRTSADARPDVKLPLEALQKLGPFEDRVAAAKRLAKSDRGQAIVEARIAVALDPRSAEAHVVLGDLYEAAENKNKAREAYTHALGIDANNDAAKAGLERVGDGS